MKGITFGEYHSYRDLHLILTEKTIGTPSPKTELIDIPGSDGVLDFTEFFDGVKYNNRELSFEFSTLVPQSEFMTLFSMVQNALHGKKMMISLDADPEWYYIGRISVSEWKADRRIGLLTIDCDCEPYKYRLTSQIVNLAGRNLINLDAGIITDEGVWTKDATGYTFTRRTGTGGSFVSWKVPVKKGQQYTFSADYTLTTRLLYVYKERLFGTLVVKAQSGEPAIFTAEEAGIYVFGIYVTSAATEGTFANIMLEEGGTRGAFVAYDKTVKTVEATFNNTRRPAVPTVYANGSLTVESPATFITLAEGANVLPEFTFQKGETTLIFKGNGTAVVEWKEGGL